MTTEDHASDTARTPPVATTASVVSPAGNGNVAATARETPTPSQTATRQTGACSVIIPLHNRASLTRQCLNTVLAQHDEGIEREIVVVDDGSTDLTARLLAAYADRIRVVSHPTAQGFAAACNAGAAVATGEYLVFLNNDTLPRAGWLRALTTYAADHPEAAVIGAKLLYPNDTVQHAGIVIGLDRYPHHLYAGFPADHPAINKSRRFQAVTAACCLIRAEAFVAASGFDTAFVNSWEDVDLCLRLGQFGHEVHFCHDSVVYHLESASRDLLGTQETENRGRYEQRWRDRVRPDDLAYYAADGLLSAAYTAHYPIRLTASPLLAGINSGDHERTADRLLQQRADQVALLLRNNILLNIRVQEAELQAQAAAARAEQAEARGGATEGDPPPLPDLDPGTAAPVAADAVRQEPSPSPPTSPPPQAAQRPVNPIIGSCERPGREPEVVAGSFLVVSGWTLSKAGILGVEAIVNGAVRGHITYGQVQRPDVAIIHPGYPDGENCGFLGRVPVEGLADGDHKLVIRVTALDGFRVELKTQFEVDSTAKITGRVLAACDKPAPYTRTVVRDRLMVVGWALSPSGVRDVATFVDGESLGSVAYGALRPDVALSHPDYPSSDHCGFTGSVPVDGLADGEHLLLVRVTAFDGQRAEVAAHFEVDTTVADIGEVPHINAQYPTWLRAHLPTDAQLSDAAQQATALAYRPKISLIAPIGLESPVWLPPLLDALRAQVYDNWELCIAPDAVSDDTLPALLADATAGDPRIRLLPKLRVTGFANAANKALAQIDGEFAAWLDGDDVLSPLALFEVVHALNDAPDTDILYVDEDKVDDATGLRWDPFFKPDWSPDLLFSMNYLGPLTFYRRSLIQELGGLRRGFKGADRYDLALRATERTDRVHHVPALLTSRRVKVAAGLTPDDAPLKTAQKALSQALSRRNIDGRVEPGLVPARWRVRYDLAEQPEITLVMPTGGKMQFLQPCLESILSESTYPNVRFLIIDNSEGTEVADLCAKLAVDHPGIRREPFSLTPFNFSAIINHAIPLVETPYLVLLNDDITVITPDWLETMLEHAQRPDVGVVGTKLLFPDDTIQHAGVILGPYEGTGHAFKQYAGNYQGYFGLPNVIRDYSAVTFACAMLRREVFDEAGLLDAEHLPIAFNDVDMCLRIGEHGYRIIYTPHAVLYHHESVTKKVIAAPSEIAHLRTRWGHVIEHDPFYNPNLTRRGEDCSLNMESATSQ